MGSTTLTASNDCLISKCKILNYEEQVACWKKYKEENDKDALERLIFCYLRLAFSLVDSFNCPQYREELQAEAYYAVIKAIDFWNPEKGKLSTIVHPIVIQSIMNYLRHANKVITIPNAARAFYKDIQDNEESQRLNYKQRVKIEHISAVDNLKRLTPKLLEAIEDGKVGADALNKSEHNEEIADLHLKLSLLDGKTRFILVHYFGIKEPRYSLKQLKKILNLKIHTIKANISSGLLNLRQMGVCRSCEKHFTPNANFKYYCSTACKQLYLSSLNTGYSKCKHCGKLFIPTSKFRKYCSYACKETSRRSRYATQWYRRNGQDRDAQHLCSH